MGVTGPGLFADDEAMDVRTVYSNLRKFGISGEEAWDILAKQCGIHDKPLEQSSVFHLAIADLLWKDGRLPDEVRNRALSIIEGNIDLDRWEDAVSRKKRKAVLEKLALQLYSVPPTPVKIPARYIENCEWRIGDIIAFETHLKHYALFRIVGYFTRFGGQSPIIEMLDWNKDYIPPKATIKTLPLMERHSKQIDFFVENAREKWEEWKMSGRLARWPDDITMEEYISYFYLHPLLPLVRSSEKDRVFKKAEYLDINIASPRRFLPQWLPVNAWRMWKDVDGWLHCNFGSRFPSKYAWANEHAQREGR